MNYNLSYKDGFKKLYKKFLNSEKGLKYLDVDGISPEKLDVALMSKKYHTSRVAEVTIDQNANANEEFSPNNYQAEITKGILKSEGNYLLWKYSKEKFGEERANELIKDLWEGRLYFHDSSGVGIQMPYCFAFSTTNIMNEGRPYGQLYSKPPKRADSFIAQVTEVCMDMSQEFVGAVSPSDLIVNYCWYAKKEDLSEYQILNDFQKFVHVMNNKFRVSGQSPFTNLSLFDLPNLKKVFGEAVYPDFTTPDFEYIMKVQKLVGEWFSKGDVSTGLPFRFPVMTVNLSVTEDRKVEDLDFLDWVSKTNIEKGCFNIYINSGNKIATCCRYSNDFSQMKFRSDSFGNGGLNLGSHRVVTLNLPNVALSAGKDQQKFFQLLEERLTAATDLLNVHRYLLEIRVEQGFLKFFKPLNWFSLKSLFSTYGIIGLYEMGSFMGLPMETEEGQQFVTAVLKFIENRAEEESSKSGYSFNVEEIPGESTAVSLAYKDTLTFGEEQHFTLYSNQYVPLTAEFGTVDRIKLTGRFMKYLSGGGIAHINIQDRLTEPIQMKNLIELSVACGVEHFAINYGFGICVNDHASVVGSGKICPVCQGDIEDWLTRIIGYFTKTSSWNSVRKNYDHPIRKWS